MIVGIPKGLLYDRYFVFFKTFFKNLGAVIVTSEDTNKKIIDMGVNCCVDEACLPVKVFHGHAASLKEKCDLMLIPRIMGIRENEYICPKFCGLPEMVSCNISNMPLLTTGQIFMNNPDKLYRWALKTGSVVTKNKRIIKSAFKKAVIKQNKHKTGIKDIAYKINIVLAGHPYNISDNYVNMNIVQKLKKMKTGIITEEFINEDFIEREIRMLYKKPFWTFARNSIGACRYAAKEKKYDGIIYLSSFCCGIDSVVIELIKDSIGDFPMLVLKLDEQTGEAGFNTRIEAFIDMIERRKEFEDNFSAYGKRIYCGENPI